MNALSFLIYMIGAITNLLNVINVVTIISTFSIVILLVILFFAFVEDAEKSTMASIYSWIKTFGVALAFATFFQIVIPTKETMVLIAASEVGEYVINTEAVQSASDEIGALSKDSIGLLREYIASEVNALRGARETKETK